MAKTRAPYRARSGRSKEPLKENSQPKKNLYRPEVQETKYFETGMQNLHLNLNHGSPGFYILSVKSSKGLIGVKKIIKCSNGG